MAYDKKLAERVRATLGNIPALEKKMFGGVGYMLHGNMACGILGDDLIVRVGKENYAAAMARPHTRIFESRGRKMSGWVLVAPQGTADAANLNAWVEAGINFALTLPPK
jgi:TfoX/Sxy family transcriptional regulator of competence genes